MRCAGIPTSPKTREKWESRYFFFDFFFAGGLADFLAGLGADFFAGAFFGFGAGLCTGFALAAGSVMAGDRETVADDLVQETTHVSRIRLDAANAGKNKKVTPEQAA